MYDLRRFSLGDMTRCGAALRKIGSGASSMEEVAIRIVRYLYDAFRVADSPEPACALVRIFVTLPFGDLDDDLQRFARGLLGSEPTPTTKCLTLLATAGAEDAWNARRASVGHRALPLASEESVARSPMIAQLLRQLGVETATLLRADGRLLIDTEQHSFNVFYIPEAKDSPYIPAQREFVIPYGIQSVLGFGGLLPTGEMFATILFTRASVPRESAELFKPLALNVKVAMLPFAKGPVFA